MYSHTVYMLKTLCSLQQEVGEGGRIQVKGVSFRRFKLSNFSKFNKCLVPAALMEIELRSKHSFYSPPQRKSHLYTWGSLYK